MNDPSYVAPHAPKRDALATVAYVCVILATIGYAFETIRQQVAATKAVVAQGPQAGRIEQSAYTNANAAHLTLTNLNPYSVEACVRGFVKSKRAGVAGRVQSAPVCTGEMKPRTTVVLEAPYPVGAIEALCSGEPDRFGIAHIDWGRCDFDLEPVVSK